MSHKRPQEDSTKGRPSEAFTPDQDKRRRVPTLRKIKEQTVVARSSAVAEFRVMTQGICELLWIKIILDDLKVKWNESMRLYCDNKLAISITHNPVQHDRAKHIEIDELFIRRS
ncbi:calmodulin-binding protein 60 A-like isoform X2 [Gossypium australe]|uniref:Calmodulin-binding protein 60 A-like isoform X2 n=1 Tax=Gossypium australe TaxID=47621 RepID=A0A5B6UJ34_9ROSI|nr:calmodulin-binding protein 60 A-like isoform X2 [Gossypium australe]